ncbi:MAG: glycoside hydrolase family 88 protein [Puniceicoccales bacterium]|nr:glycoside hydrolase family 88 protein [Puniceicoccales bacterium]
MRKTLFRCLTITALFSGSTLAQGAMDVPAMPPYAEDQTLLTTDGAWCWFSDPRAIYLDGTLIGGSVDKEGSIWAFSYNSQDEKTNSYKLHEKLDYDDHANPSFLALPDKRIVSFYSAHGGTRNSPIYYRITKQPGDISEWGEAGKITPQIKGAMGNCYTNPAQLSDENNRIYLLFRGANFKPNLVYTDDLQTWSDAQTIIQEGNKSGRPYLKAANNGKNKIFMAFTDGHPRNEPTNSIYFVMYKGGKFWKADGSEVGNLKDGPVAPSACDKVYDATKTYDKSWIWDVAYDENEYPVLVYARFSHVMTEHSYWYARWDGKKWNNHRITKAGRWFQRNDYPKETSEYECNYSGGVYLDHNDPDVVYTSRPIKDVFEIEKWVTADQGKTWQSSAVTGASEKDNVRPFVAWGDNKGQSNVLWMYNYKYPGFRAYDTAIRLNKKAEPFSAQFKKEDVLGIARKVADWQIGYFPTQPSSKAPYSWLNGALYVGMFDWAELSGDAKYDQWLQRTFNRMIWQVGPYMYHADDICVGQTYLDMYAKHRKDAMKMPTQARADWVIQNRDLDPAKMVHGTSRQYERWSWCDALFMAPPVYARLYTLTGDKKYMDFADSEFKATYAKLFDKEEHLFYRDASYINKREANGEKVFWGRGNGWVMGGLAEMLKSLPQDDKVYRPYYESLLKEMSERLLGLQQADGFWRASLLDPASYPAPETSGTGFITYGLAYGVNAGLLPKEKYLPAVEKGWQALVSSVNTEGKLCWVQPVGADPRKVQKKSTEVYGTGAFLMTAAEVYKLSQ